MESVFPGEMPLNVAADWTESMTKPNVSVLIPTFNRAHFLAECLDSVLGQTIPPSQVIVINDGSTDNTREVIAPYMDRIEYIEKENGGKSTALNFAMPRVRGDYVWIMDDDDVALPDAIETHLAVLDNEPDIGFTYTSGYIGRTGPRGGGIQVLRPSPLPGVPEGEFFIRYMQGCLVHHDAMVVRRACYAVLGGFDPELVRGQDYEMTLRLARRFRGLRIDKPTIIVRLHSGVRGSESDQFDAGRRFAKWREYDQKIFRRLRGELELSEYLPAEVGNRPLGPLEMRRAYLTRMCMMVGKGIFDDMLCDLRHALAQTGEGPPLTQPEQDCLSRAVGQLWPGDRLVCDPEFAKSVRLLCTGQAGRDVIIGMARGLYWPVKDALQARRYQVFARIVLGAWRLVGLRGCLLAFMYKVRRALGPNGLRTPAGANGRASQEPQ
jgi:glycosyltransferase involved in cell wall biosynthesis